MIEVKHPLPEWRFMMAAFAGLFGSGWGWWQLQRNERENWWILLIFLGGLGVWGYAVFGLLNWSFAL